VLEGIIPKTAVKMKETRKTRIRKEMVGASKREKIMETRKSQPIKKPNGDLHWHNWIVDGTQMRRSDQVG